MGGFIEDIIGGVAESVIAPAQRVAGIVTNRRSNEEIAAPAPAFIIPEIVLPTPDAVKSVSSQSAGRKARLAKFRPTAGRASTIATSSQGATGDVKKRALIGGAKRVQGSILGAM